MTTFAEPHRVHHRALTRSAVARRMLPLQALHEQDWLHPASIGLMAGVNRTDGRRLRHRRSRTHTGHLPQSMAGPPTISGTRHPARLALSHRHQHFASKRSVADPNDTSDQPPTGSRPATWPGSNHSPTHSSTTTKATSISTTSLTTPEPRRKPKLSAPKQSAWRSSPKSNSSRRANARRSFFETFSNGPPLTPQHFSTPPSCRPTACCNTVDCALHANPRPRFFGERASSRQGHWRGRARYRVRF